MQPASRTNLSFHSSSDCSVRPVYLDENMSAGSSSAVGGGSGGTPYASDAFRSARSAETTSLGGNGLTLLTTTRPTPGTHRAPDPPLSRQSSTALNARTASAWSAQQENHAPHAAGREPSSGPPERRSTAAGLPQLEYPTEPSSPPPPTALPRRAKPSHYGALPSAGAGAVLAARANAPPSSTAGANETNDEEGGWWNSAVAVFRSGQQRMNQYVSNMVDPSGGAAGKNVKKSSMNNRRELDNSMSLSSPTANSNVTVSSGFGGLFQDVGGHSPYHDESSADPYGVDGGGGGRGGNRGGSRMAERVRVEATDEPFGPLPPMARPIPETTEEEQLLDEAIDVDAEPPTIEVDLVSALHGYCDNPNEAFGHLVAAALTSRSQERPVTGAEIAEARHNPFLVRMIVASGCLDNEDPVAQQNVQDTLNSLMPDGNTDFAPALYEYLGTFFQLPFIKLTHGQYTLLKSCGFENISLMHKNKHVLPTDRFHSVLINYSRPVASVNLIFVVLAFLSSTACTVSIAIVLANWMTIANPGYQSYGFYTLIAYGCGYALYLIFMVYFTRTREDESVYEDTSGLTMPSPYVAVCPVLPIFEVLCLVKYLRARPYKLLAYSHNVLVASRLSSICYAFCFGFPQWVVQSYFSYTSVVVERQFQRRWSLYFLMVTVLVQWGIALIRFCYMMLAYDSTSGLGFACFNVRHVRHSIERHSGVPKIMYYLFVYLLETGVYIVVASSIQLGNMKDCIFLPTCVISISGVLMLLILIVYVVVIFREGVLVALSFASIPICMLVVATTVLGALPISTACKDFNHLVFERGFYFGYISYGAFFLSFAIWVVMILFVIAQKACDVKLFPRLTATSVRGDNKKSSGKAGDGGDTAKYTGRSAGANSAAAAAGTGVGGDGDQSQL